MKSYSNKKKKKTIDEKLTRYCKLIELCNYKFAKKLKGIEDLSNYNNIGLYQWKSIIWDLTKDF